MTFSPGTYFALPTPTLHSTLAALSGVGILMTTLVALSLGWNMALTCTVYSTRDLPISSTMGCTRNGRLMLDVERYLRRRSNPSSVSTRAERGERATQRGRAGRRTA